MNIEIQLSDGALENREILLDKPGTGKEIQNLFHTEKVITIHSREATLEDIFKHITGRGLAG